ncbi:MAG: hypothetical protein HY796_00015 [Elusimicrobia bacterium]|nr:hypothetical protein [Elusimicrobiota bacterium]
MGVIALLFGLALLGAGFASGQGLLWLAISAIVSILGFIIGLKQIKDWGKEFNNWRERQGIRDKIKVEADLGKTAKQLQDNGDIPNNERLREIGFTDDELREWKLLE